jgi:hypothetical protein
LAYRVQVGALGGLDKETLLILRQPKGHTRESRDGRPFEARIPTTRQGASLTAGALLAREWNGNLERVMVPERGFAWNGETYGSLSQGRQGDDRHKMERPSQVRFCNRSTRSSPLEMRLRSRVSAITCARNCRT